MNKKDKTLMIVLGIFTLVIVTTAASFAFFTYSRTSNTKTTISTGDLQFSYFERKESLSISNQFPLADSVGAKDDANAYEFQVGMNSTSTEQKMNYNVILVSNNTGDKVFTHDQIKYNISRDNTYLKGDTSTGLKLSTVSGLTAGTSTGEGVVLANQPINSGDVHNYKLRIWISDDVNYSSTPDENGTSTGVYNNYTYSLKVKITAAQYSVYTVTGKLTNQNGEAIANTTIAAHSTLQVTTTDSEGNYTLEGLESGSHTLYVMDGYTVDQVKAMSENEITENSKGSKEFNVTKSGTVNLTVEVIPSYSWELTNDVNGNGKADIGDLICISTECFYVYKTSETEIKALAQYNLMVGNEYDSSSYTTTPLANPTGLQSAQARGLVNGDAKFYGTTAFSSNAQKGVNYSDYTGSIVEGYVNNYKTKLNNEMQANIISASLITKGEIETLVNRGNALSYGELTSTASDLTGKEWIYSTSYWSGSADITDYVWYVNSDGGLHSSGYNCDYYFGVRPVITILSSDI